MASCVEQFLSKLEHRNWLDIYESLRIIMNDIPMFTSEQFLLLRNGLERLLGIPRLVKLYRKEYLHSYHNCSFLIILSNLWQYCFRVDVPWVLPFSAENESKSTLACTILCSEYLIALLMERFVIEKLNTLFPPFISQWPDGVDQEARVWWANVYKKNIYTSYIHRDEVVAMLLLALPSLGDSIRLNKCSCDDSNVMLQTVSHTLYPLLVNEVKQLLHSDTSFTWDHDTIWKLPSYIRVFFYIYAWAMEIKTMYPRIVIQIANVNPFTFELPRCVNSSVDLLFLCFRHHWLYIGNGNIWYFPGEETITPKECDSGIYPSSLKEWVAPFLETPLADIKGIEQCASYTTLECLLYKLMLIHCV